MRNEKLFGNNTECKSLNFLIKFRAWREKSKEWIKFSVNPTITQDLFTFREIIIKEQLNQWFRYTGVDDSKGTEIYEGDIVRIKAFNMVHETEVFFQEGMFGIQWIEYTSSTTMLKLVNWYESIEVIGNNYHPQIAEVIEL